MVLVLMVLIGLMKMCEEIDVMCMLGMDFDMVLILLCVLVLFIMLLIFGLIVNVLGLIGGVIMFWIEFGILFSMFCYCLVVEIGVEYVIVGISKVLVFVIVIGIIGCYVGMKVGKDVELLGVQILCVVVNVIFVVIVIDVLFLIFFVEIGI